MLWNMINNLSPRLHKLWRLISQWLAYITDTGLDRVPRALTEGYLLGLLLVGLIVCICLSHFRILSLAELASNQFVLALIGGLIAILAVLLTITMIAAQLAAQSYAPMVMTLHTRSPYFIGFILSYIGSIIGLFILLAQDPWNKDEITFHLWMDAVILIGLFNIIYLIPFLIHTIKLLTPENIIKALIIKVEPRHFTDVYINDAESPGSIHYVTVRSRDDEYTFKSITKDIVPERKLRDALRPIEDMIMRATNNGDRTTIRTSLDLVMNRYRYLMAKRITPMKANKIIQFFAEFLRDIAEYSIDMSNLQIAGDVLERYRELRAPIEHLGLPRSEFYLYKIVDSIKQRALIASEKGTGTIDMGRVDRICSTFFSETSETVN